MSNNKMKLAEEAVALINEFKKQAEIVCESSIETLEIKENGNIIWVDDSYDGEKEYPLKKISKIFSTDMEGWGPQSAAFYEAISTEESELEYHYGRLSKEEFIEFVGNLKYTEFRCEEIYKRLKQIEKEA